MSLSSVGIEYREVEELTAACISKEIQKRSELPDIFRQIRSSVPKKKIAGPPFCIFKFVSSAKSGHEVIAGFPVHDDIKIFHAGITLERIPSMQVLSLVHEGPADQLSSAYGTVFGTASKGGIISDEFCREIYVDEGNPQGERIEVQFVIHDWNKLLAEHVKRVLGSDAEHTLLTGIDGITPDSSVEDRFLWVKAMMTQLLATCDEPQVYDILSSCAHVFPAEPINKARDTYEKAGKETGDAWKAVDAVIVLMAEDAAWAKPPYREGNVLFAAKSPRDPKGYEAATTDAEKRSAACFCPVIRDKLDAGMPVEYCYCGSGWFRRQWEEITGRSVRIEIIKSVLNGDDHCEFAVHLPDDL